jgi:hypothetical protein
LRNQYHSSRILTFVRQSILVLLLL